MADNSTAVVVDARTLRTTTKKSPQIPGGNAIIAASSKILATRWKCSQGDQEGEEHNVHYRGGEPVNIRPVGAVSY